MFYKLVFTKNNVKPTKYIDKQSYVYNVWLQCWSIPLKVK